MGRAAARAAMTLLATAVACAPALREPPRLDELTGGAERAAGRPGAEVAEEAESLYSRRTIPAVRRAVGLWLEAAASEAERVPALVGAARARVWLAVRERTGEARRAAAVSAVQVAQLCKLDAPQEPRCDYWLAVALGVQARERRSTGLYALPSIIELLDRVAGTVPDLDHGGPDRVLSLLYLRAPGWPLGPGDDDLGLDHARRAVSVAPDYPPNRLALAEALEATGDLEAAGVARDEAARSARTWIERGDPDAEEWLEQAIRATRE